MATKLSAGWLAVVGGDRDGQEWYPPNEPVVGRPVFLGLPGDKPRTTNYHYAQNSTGIVVKWSEKVTTEGKNVKG